MAVRRNDGVVHDLLRNGALEEGLQVSTDTARVDGNADRDCRRASVARTLGRRRIVLLILLGILFVSVAAVSQISSSYFVDKPPTLVPFFNPKGALLCVGTFSLTSDF